jgi:hypothetical protein
MARRGSVLARCRGGSARSLGGVRRRESSGAAPGWEKRKKRWRLLVGEKKGLERRVRVWRYL